MKRFWCIQLALILCVCITGQILRHTLYDSGVRNITPIEDAQAFQGGATLLSDQDGGSWNYKELKESYDTAGTILVVHTADQLKQYDFYLTQTVLVDEVIRGDVNLKNATIKISDYGFANNTEFRGLRYYSTQSLLKKDCQYLVFLQALEMSTYLDPPIFVYAAIVGGFNLTENLTELIKTSEAETTYQEVKDMDYFCSSPTLFEIIEKIKAQVLNEYGQ